MQIKAHNFYNILFSILPFPLYFHLFLLCWEFSRLHRAFLNLILVPLRQHPPPPIQASVSPFQLVIKLKWVVLEIALRHCVLLLFSYNWLFVLEWCCLNHSSIAKSQSGSSNNNFFVVRCMNISNNFCWNRKHNKRWQFKTK